MIVIVAVWAGASTTSTRCVDEAVQMVKDNERITCAVPWLSSVAESRPSQGRLARGPLEPVDAAAADRI